MKSLFNKHNRRLRKAGCIAILGSLLVFQSGHAQNAIITGDNWSGGYYDYQSYTFGDSFTVGSQPFTINALGVWGGYGFTSAHTVGLWTASGTLLDSISISPGAADVVMNTFSYDYITPITLTANTTYVLGVFYANNNTDDVWMDGVSPASDFNSDVTFGAAYYNSGGSLAFPTGGGRTDMNYIGANAADIAPVPEPSAGALLAFGGLAGLVWRRHKD